MAQHATVADFYKTDLALDPEVPGPNISEDIQQDLARLMAWYNNGPFFRRLSCDVDGRLYVSMAGVSTPLISWGQKAVAATVTKIFPDNPNRRQFIIQNLGNYDMWLGYDNTVANNKGMRVPVGGIVSDSIYTGEVWGISDNAAITIAFREV